MDFIFEELVGAAVELVWEFVLKPVFRFFKRLIRHEL